MGHWKLKGNSTAFKSVSFRSVQFSRLERTVLMPYTARLTPSPCFQTALALLMILCVGLVVVTWKETDIFSAGRIQQIGYATSFRGAGRRKLAAYSDYEVNQDQLMGAEVGFVAGLVVMLVLLLCLCSCCSRRFSLCEVLTCFCLWEVCCDDRRGGDFIRF